MVQPKRRYVQMTDRDKIYKILDTVDTTDRTEKGAMSTLKLLEEKIVKRLVKARGELTNDEFIEVLSKLIELRKDVQSSEDFKLEVASMWDDWTKIRKAMKKLTNTMGMDDINELYKYQEAKKYIKKLVELRKRLEKIELHNIGNQGKKFMELKNNMIIASGYAILED